MPPNDAMFLLGESREHPLHVGGLQLFDLPPGAGPDFLGELRRDLLADHGRVRRTFRLRPQTPVDTLGQVAWREDPELDLNYHVGLSALPSPGRVRELLELTSRLHGSLLDRHRPLWEMYLIEGLRDGRFAVYTKVHHALLDGVSALRVLEQSLSSDPDERDMPAPFARRRTGAAPRPRAGGNRLGAPVELAERALGLTRGLGETAGLLPTVLRSVGDAVRGESTALPYEAPKSMLNVPITGARRFAAESWPMGRISAVQQATGASVNDVVLAVSAGALRKYLLDAGALPEQPLIAAVPVSLRRDASGRQQGNAGRGNKLGAVLCDLATDEPAPEPRLRRIQDSMRRGKSVLDGLTPLQAMLFSALRIGGLALAPLPGMASHARPPFNVIISNVPGSPQPLYWNGALMRGFYPVSIPYEGQALNITALSYAGQLEFGLTGCRRSVPHLQRVLTHLESSLAALERL
jgi:WS/DGAT/MGAT family acyltransferase